MHLQQHLALHQPPKSVTHHYQLPLLPHWEPPSTYVHTHTGSSHVLLKERPPFQLSHCLLLLLLECSSCPLWRANSHSHSAIANRSTPQRGLPSASSSDSLSPSLSVVSTICFLTPAVTKLILSRAVYSNFPLPEILLFVLLITQRQLWSKNIQLKSFQK